MIPGYVRTKGWSAVDWPIVYLELILVSSPYLINIFSWYFRVVTCLKFRVTGACIATSRKLSLSKILDEFFRSPSTTSRYLSECPVKVLHADFYNFVRFTLLTNGDDTPSVPVVTFYIQKDVFGNFNSFLLILFIEIFELLVRKPITEMLKNQFWIGFIFFSRWGLVILCHRDWTHDYIKREIQKCYFCLFDLSKLGKLKTPTGAQDRAMSVGHPLGSHSCGAGVG